MACIMKQKVVLGFLTSGFLTGAAQRHQENALTVQSSSSSSSSSSISTATMLFTLFPLTVASAVASADSKDSAASSSLIKEVSGFSRTFYTGSDIGAFVTSNIDAMAKSCMFAMTVSYLLSCSIYAHCMLVVRSTAEPFDIIGFYLFKVETLAMPDFVNSEWDGKTDLSMKGKTKASRSPEKVLHLLALGCSAKAPKGLGALLMDSVKSLAYDWKIKFVFLDAMKPLNTTYYNFAGFVTVTPCILKAGNEPTAGIVPMMYKTDDNFNADVHAFLEANCSAVPDDSTVWSKSTCTLGHERSAEAIANFLWTDRSDYDAENTLTMIARRENYDMIEIKKLWRMRQICYAAQAEASKTLKKSHSRPFDFFEPAFVMPKHILTATESSDLKDSFMAFLNTTKA